MKSTGYVLIIILILILPVNIYANNDWMKEQNALELNKAALKLFDSGRWPRALDNVTRALELEPDNMKIRYNYALMLFKMRKFVISKRECITILKENPNNKNAMSLFLASIEGIKSSPGGDDPELVGLVPGEMKENNSEDTKVPKDVVDIINASLISRDYNYTWENLCIEVKGIVEKSTFVRSSNIIAKNEVKAGRNLEVIINSFEIKKNLGVARFSLMIERKTTPELKEALNGETSYIERINNYQFFKYEQGKWRLYPNSVYGKTLSRFFLTFKGIELDTSVDIKYKGTWNDKNYFFLDRFEKLWRRRNPQRSNNAKVMKTAYGYMNALKNLDHKKAFNSLSSFSKNSLNLPKLRNILVYNNIYQIEIGNVQVEKDYAQCEFTIQNINYDYSRNEISLTKLNSFLWLSYEEAEWKIVDYIHKKKFWDNKKTLLTSFKYMEDQFAVFNGRDWIDASTEFRKRMERELEK